MKTVKSFLGGLLFIIIWPPSLYSQTEKKEIDSKLKIGSKFIITRNGYSALTNTNFIDYNYGLQLIKRIQNSKSSIESGIYVVNCTFNVSEFYKFLSLPLNYRLDLKYLYLGGGVLGNISLSNNYRNLKKFTLGCNLEIGIEKSIGNRFSYFVEGQWFCIPIRTISADFNDMGFTNSGLAIGLNYKL